MSYIHSRKLAGRTKGLTNKARVEKKKSEKEAKYKIVCRYVHEIKYSQAIMKLCKKDIFSIIHDEERINFGLHPNFKFPYDTALSRIRRHSYKGNFFNSPLIAAEEKFVQMILAMSKMKRSLNVSDGLNLINDLIAGTELQTKLIEWKKFHRIYHTDVADLGIVGNNYWRAFMKRNGHKLKIKSGKKYAVDRANFTSYLNFKDMYDQIEESLVGDSKVAVKLPEPIWMNKDGEEVECEDDAFGCKVGIDIKFPQMCITLDEVGCNLTQEKDGAKGGESYLCGVEEVPYQCAATKNSHFTCLGLTTLSGEAVMCVIIMQGKRRKLVTETGIDWDKLCHADDKFFDI